MINYNQIKTAPVNLADFEDAAAVAGNWTPAWTAFIAACVAQNKNGFVPSGTYAMDSRPPSAAHP